MEAEAIPLPREEQTPPVINTYLVNGEKGWRKNQLWREYRGRKNTEQECFCGSGKAFGSTPSSARVSSLGLFPSVAIALSELAYSAVLSCRIFSVFAIENIPKKIVPFIHVEMIQRDLLKIYKNSS